MSDCPLSVAEFERLLSRGRGKAILHLKQHDAAPYLETIYNCCLTNTSYGRYCKDPRDAYLIESVMLSGEADVICEGIIQSVHNRGVHFVNLQQRFALLGQFARRQDKMARQAMYAWCRLHYEPQQFDPDLFNPLLELDGIKAFLFLLDPRQSNRYFDMDGDNAYDFKCFLEVLENRFGKSEIRENLYHAVQDRPALASLIEDVYQRQHASEEKRAYAVTQQQELAKLSYVELKRKIEAKEIDANYSFHYWSQTASEADFLAAAVDFNTLDLPLGYLLRYAHMFIRRPFPLDDLSRLLDLIYMNGQPPIQQVNPVILGVFQHLSHPRVRTLAFDLIKGGQYTGRGVGLLANNFEVGDWTLIDSLFDGRLDGLEHDYEYHDLGFSIQKIFKKHPSPDAIPSLLRMFDVNPCSRCRMDVVESLVSLNALPDWIAEECFYDANLDLRAYAERGFTHASDD